MSLPHYRVVPSALQYHRRIPVENIVHTSVYAHVTPTAEDTVVPVVLVADPQSGAWRVRWEFGILGEISAAHRDDYPEMNRITGSGYLPEAVAGISARGSDGTVAVDVFLSEPLLAVPRNNVSEDTLVLPPGDMFVVDTTTGEFSPADLAQASPGQWLIVLAEVAGKPVATLNGRVVGTFSDESQDTILSYIHAAQQDNSGTLVAARGYIVDSVAAIDAGQPHGDAERVFPLHVPAHRPADNAHTTEFADGSWAVTMAESEAADPADAVSPHDNARAIESPHDPEALSALDNHASPDLSAHPEMHELAREHMSQMEQVFERRAQRKYDGQPRHSLRGRHRKRD